MTLPTDEEIERVLMDRPGDDIYPEVKDQVDTVDREEKEIKEKLVAIILKDMALDAAIATSCDTTGKVLTYLSQKWGIEAPEFTGDIMMRNFSRISKLKLSLEYAKLIGLDGDVLDLTVKAEIDRLWNGDSNSALLKKLLVSKTQPTTMATSVPQTTLSDFGVKAK